MKSDNSAVQIPVIISSTLVFWNHWVRVVFNNALVLHYSASISSQYEFVANVPVTEYSQESHWKGWETERTGIMRTRDKLPAPKNISHGSPNSTVGRSVLLKLCYNSIPEMGTHKHTHSQNAASLLRAMCRMAEQSFVIEITLNIFLTGFPYSAVVLVCRRRYHGALHTAKCNNGTRQCED
jgi:hypothetical protein